MIGVTRRGTVIACSAVLFIPLTAPLLAEEAGGRVAIEFRRGDVNLDAQVTVADAVVLLEHLFAAGPAPVCEDAADANDDGVLDLADAVACLRSLFGERQVPLPYPGAHQPGYDDPATDGFLCGDPPPELVLDADEMFERLTATAWVYIVGRPGFQTRHTYALKPHGDYSWEVFSDIPHEFERGQWSFKKTSDGGGLLLLSDGGCRRFAFRADGFLHFGRRWIFQRLGTSEPCADCRRENLPQVEPGC